MTRSEKQLKAVSKQLRSLVQKVEKLAGLTAMEKPVKVIPRTRRKKIVKKSVPGKAAAAKSTILDRVYHAVKASKKGINISNIKKRVGLGTRQLSNALHKLTKKGLIKAESRGIYIKA